MGLGRLMCEVGEWVAKSTWGKGEMYLHVEADNTAAKALYTAMGYELSEKSLGPEESRRENMDKILFFGRQI
jgi:ribosomal protein S18 acetylase RimI-like enzyme